MAVSMRGNGPKEVSLDRENISCPTLQTVFHKPESTKLTDDATQI
jgi:hypothetical protein